MKKKFAVIVSILGILGFLNSLYLCPCANAVEEDIFIAGIAYSLYAVPPLKNTVKEDEKYSQPVLKYAPPIVQKPRKIKENTPVMVKYAPPSFFKEQTKIEENIVYPEYAVPILDNENNKNNKNEKIESDIRLDILFFEEK